jgi:signal transduction histidine kinase
MMKEIPHRDPPSDTLRLETALRRSEKLAMAGRLAASVMHEINNPSQVIADLVFLLAQEADHPDLVRARAAQIEEQLVRIQYITRQTLSFFRDTPKTQSKDLVPLVETALRYQAVILEEKHIQVRKQIPDLLMAPRKLCRPEERSLFGCAHPAAIVASPLRTTGGESRRRFRLGSLKHFRVIKRMPATGSASGSAKPL